MRWAKAYPFILLCLVVTAPLNTAEPTPFGFQKIAPTQQWESGDSRAQKVQQLFNPYFQGGQFNTKHLKWSGSTGFSSQVNEITPSNPVMNPFRVTGPQNGGSLRVYFIDERGSYDNSLGIVQSTPSSGPNPLENPPSNDVLLFGKTTFSTNNPNRTESAPVKPMDYVDLGWINEGEMFELFMIADGGAPADDDDGGSGNKYDNATIDFDDSDETPAEGIFFTDPNHNLPDDLSMQFEIYEIPGQAYKDYLLFRVEEDLDDDDADFNDLYFLVELAVPEPSTYLMLGSFLFLSALVGSRNKRRRLQT